MDSKIVCNFAPQNKSKGLPKTFNRVGMFFKKAKKVMRTKKVATKVAEVKETKTSVIAPKSETKKSTRKTKVEAAPKANKATKDENASSAPAVKAVVVKATKKSDKAKKNIAPKVAEAKPKAESKETSKMKKTTKASKDVKVLSVSAPSVKSVAVAKPEVAVPTVKSLTELVNEECGKKLRVRVSAKAKTHHEICAKIKEYSEKYNIPFGYIAYCAIGTSAQKPAEFLKGYESFDEAKMQRIIKLRNIMMKHFSLKKVNDIVYHMLSGYYTKYKGNMSFFKRALDTLPRDGFKLSSYKTAKSLSSYIFAVSE